MGSLEGEGGTEVEKKGRNLFVLHFLGAWGLTALLDEVRCLERERCPWVHC